MLSQLLSKSKSRTQQKAIFYMSLSWHCIHTSVGLSSDRERREKLILTMTPHQSPIYCEYPLTVLSATYLLCKKHLHWFLSNRLPVLGYCGVISRIGQKLKRKLTFYNIAADNRCKNSVTLFGLVPNILTIEKKNIQSNTISENIKVQNTINSNAKYERNFAALFRLVPNLSNQRERPL